MAQNITNTNCSIETQTIVQGDGNIINLSPNPGPSQGTAQQLPTGIEFIPLSNPVHSFRGRKNELENLQEMLSEPRNDEQSYVLVAVCGYGGIGKTQFARKYVQENRNEYDNVLWVDAEKKEKYFENLQKLLTDKGFACYCNKDVYKHLNSNRCLFVFDNVKDIRSIKSFLPSQNNESQVLVTSQSKNWYTYKRIELDKLDSVDVEGVIEAIFNHFKIKITNKQLKDLSSKLEPIPLVLQIRVAYICNELRFLIDNNLANDIKDIIKNIDFNCDDIVLEEFQEYFLDPYDKSILAAVSQTLQKIWSKKDQASNITSKILGIAAYLRPEGINKDIFKTLLNIDNTKLNKCLLILDPYLLVHLHDGIIEIHRTIQQCLRYHYREIMKTNEYYELTLPLLIEYDDVCEYLNREIWSHNNSILKHGENYLESLCKFCKNNKCRKLYITLIDSDTRILSFLLDNSDLIRNPEFLFLAMKNCHHRNLLIERNVDINTPDEKGCVALHYSCVLKDNKNLLIIYDTENMLDLIKIGANINYKNKEGNSALHILCQTEKTNPKTEEYIFCISAILIKKGADLKIKNNVNKTAADLAREYKLDHVAELLSTRTPSGGNIPHIAAKNKLYDIVTHILEYDFFNVNEKDASGCTVLHVLCGLQTQQDTEEALFITVANLVLDRSADVSIKNKNDETAADVAKQCGRAELADFLTSPNLRRFIYIMFNSKIGHFKFMQSKDSKHVNERDESGRTLLHTVCSLKKSNNDCVEDSIHKFAKTLVMKYNVVVDDDVISAARHRYNLLESLKYIRTYRGYIRPFGIRDSDSE